MTLAYWNRVGGLLLEEFCAVPRSRECGGRWMDGVIVHGRENRRAKKGEVVDLVGASITVVQAKARRLNMPLMGQAFFSVKLMEPFRPVAIHSVALCLQDDPILRPLIEAYPGFEVVVLSEAEISAAADLLPDGNHI
ncbi:MAG: hypothetical protein ACR2GK_07410 [Gemmatimonadaceae bacterium]